MSKPALPRTNYKKIVIPIVIIVVTIALMMVIFKNPPESIRKKISKAPQMTVATMTLVPHTYEVKIQSFGTVKPRTESILFAQVSGQIIKVSKQFRDGGFFEQGDILIQLDDRDHRAEVKIAQASLMSAKQSLLEEEAKTRQAKADWQRLGNGKVASALVLRQPQLEATKALVLSAEAQLDKAKLSLERTKIVAPYAGRILQKHVDLGQVISSNTQLADIFAVDYVEIRLPIKNKDLPLMKLPEEYQNAHEQSEAEGKDPTLFSNVIISSDLMGEQAWRGKIVRTESAINEASQQLYVVAQVIRPYDGKYNHGAQIKMGQYVTAEITGRNVEDALVIPSSAIYQGSYVYIVENGLLMRKEVQLSWQNGTESIVSKGLNPGDELVITSLGQVSSGTPVAIEGQAPAKPERRNRNTKKSPKELKKIAAEKGITVDELIAKQQARKAKKANTEKVAN